MAVSGPGLKGLGLGIRGKCRILRLKNYILMASGRVAFMILSLCQRHIGRDNGGMDLLSAIILLLIVTDPLGNLPIVMSCLEGTKRPHFFISREVALAALVLILSLFFGPWLLRILDLSQEALQLAGGIVLFLIAIKLIFPSDTTWMGVRQGEEPWLFPLAVPLVAGPSAVATVMLFSAQYPDRMGVWVVAIIISMLVSLVIFFFAPILHRLVGRRALAAFQRLMGMLLTVIAVQMVISGIKEIFGLPGVGG